MNSPKDLYACLYVGDFPVQAHLRLHPDLEHLPCVVLDGEPPFQQVCSLNTKARLMGMEIGMTRVEIDTFSSAIVLTRDVHAESQARESLFDCVGSFSPRIENRSRNTAFLCGIDVAGTELLFGTLESLAQNLLNRVNLLGFTASIAISHNFHAAACLAMGLSPRNDFQVIATGQEAASLASLPLSVVDLTEQQTETFTQWGIHTLGMLAALPENQLIARMEGGQHLRKMARGELPHLFRPIEEPTVLEDQIVLDSPVELLDSLLFVIGTSLDRLIQHAKNHLLALASIRINLSLQDGEIHSRTVRPAAPTNDKQIWIKLLHLDLEAHPPRDAILAVALYAEPGNTSKIQLGIFSPQIPEATRLDVTLARIRAIVGENNVGRVVIKDTHAPDSYRIEPFTVPSSSSSLHIPPQHFTAARQIRTPYIVSVTLHDSRPASFFFHGVQYTVERAYGPWSSDGDWWSETLWGFEQWDLIAHAQDGSVLYCCMQRNPMNSCWQMVSLYD